MSLPNPETVVTEERLNEFYTELLPYLGGRADAGFTPVGTIIAVMGNSAPTNYLACNGQTVNIADYPELAAYFKEQFGSANYFGGDGTTTFKICDLRGEFLRGTGTNSHGNGSGNGANVGVHQDATAIPYVANYATASNPNIQMLGNQNQSVSYMDDDGARKSSSDAVIKYTKVTGTQTSTGGTSDLRTTRPTNTSVLFCIATKNIYLNPSLDYSTDEKVVGIWIDGKTIYQKTFAGTVDAYSSITNKAIGASVDKVVDVRGIVGNSVSLMGMTNDAMNTGISFVVLDNSDASNPNTFICYCKPSGQSAFVGRSYYVTIQYTKTT